MNPTCGAPTANGDPCQAPPLKGEDRCRHHEDPTASLEETNGARCGAPTRRGGLCKNHPMAGQQRCHVHLDGLEPTEAEQAARREGPLRHGYFVSGFLDDEERELFARVLEEGADIGALKQNVIAALTVRADRMMRWEAEGQNISGFATDVFTELRKSLEALQPDELEVQHSWDTDEVARQVEAVLEADRGLLIRMVPPGVQEIVREAFEQRDGEG